MKNLKMYVLLCCMAASISATGCKNEKKDNTRIAADYEKKGVDDNGASLPPCSGPCPSDLELLTMRLTIPMGSDLDISYMYSKDPKYTGWPQMAFIMIPQGNDSIKFVVDRHPRPANIKKVQDKAYAKRKKKYIFAVIESDSIRFIKKFSNGKADTLSNVQDIQTGLLLSSISHDGVYNEEQHYWINNDRNFDLIVEIDKRGIIKFLD